MNSLEPPSGSTVPLSTKETNHLQRSTKKHKGGSGSSLPPRSLRSYKGIVSNPKGDWDSSHPHESFSYEEDLSDIKDDSADCCLVILLSKEEKQRIHAPWRSTIIIKAFGKSLGYKYLDYKICAIWKLVGDMQCIDLGHDFFLTCFKLNEDYSKVVNGGPWFTGQQFLTLHRWTRSFCPSEAKISTTVVWAHLFELPIEFYNKTMLRRIGT